MPDSGKEASHQLYSGSTFACPGPEKAPFYHGCGCGIVIDTSIKCCLLKCHNVGFLPHFQLQRTADGRGRNNEDPFLTLSLKNLPVLFSQVALLPPILSMAFSTSCFENYIYFTVYQTSS